MLYYCLNVWVKLAYTIAHVGPSLLMTIWCSRIELKVHFQIKLVILTTEIKLKRQWLYFGSRDKVA